MAHPPGSDQRRSGRVLSLTGAAVGSLTGAALVLTGLAGVSPAAASVSAPSDHASVALDWDTPRSSVHADAADVAADAAERGPVRVVSLRSVAGHPQVRVRTVSGRDAAEAAVAAAQDRPGAVAVAVDTPVAALAETTGTRWNDTYRDLQWGLDRLQAEGTAARQRATGVTVAVVDTGVDDTHPDLAGVVLPGVDLVTAGGDGTADGNGHGTHVAGIVAAVADNAAGVAGLAPGASILPVRVLDNSGGGYDSDVAEGIVWAADHGASVVNLSLGGAGSSDVLAAAVGYAVSRGSVVVAAAGNSRTSGNPVTYPAAYPGVIGVAASATDDSIASFSNTGAYVDVTAPGVDIASTYRSHSYSYSTGTSMAAPFAAAAAALLRAADPTLSTDRVATLLASTATDLGPAGRDDLSGSGLIDPLAALCEATSCAAPAPAPAPAETSTATGDVQPAAPAAPAPAPAPAVEQGTPAAPAPRTTTTRLDPAPAVLTYGSWITATGAVVDAGSGTGVGGAQVQVCTRPRPATSFTCTGRTADAAGRFAYAVQARATTEVYATHPGTDATAASVSTTLTWRVSARVSVTTAGDTVSARVSPAARQKVTLQRWTGTRWAASDADRVGARGSVAFSDLRPGRYRVKVAATATLAPVTSRAVRVGR